MKAKDNKKELIPYSLMNLMYALVAVLVIGLLTNVDLAGYMPFGGRNGGIWMTLISFVGLILSYIELKWTNVFAKSKRSTHTLEIYVLIIFYVVFFIIGIVKFYNAYIFMPGN